MQDNVFALVALIADIKTLRYTPAGIPVLELILKHESIQTEANINRKIAFKIAAKIIGDKAKTVQYQKDAKVAVQGFLHIERQHDYRPVLHIQKITILDKG